MRRWIGLLLFLIVVPAIATEAAMPNDERDDIPVLLHGELATGPVALALAEAVFKNVYGEEDFKAQLPLKLLDRGNRWLVQGSRDFRDHPMPERGPYPDRMEIEIIKSNCRVVNISYYAVYPGPKVKK